MLTADHNIVFLLMNLYRLSEPWRTPTRACLPRPLHEVYTMSPDARAQRRAEMVRSGPELSR